MAIGTAPGKAILFGEHAVVYGQPAIAVPVHALLAQATVETASSGNAGRLWIEAPNIGFSGWAALSQGGETSGDASIPGTGNEAGEAPAAGPIAGLLLAARLTLKYLDAGLQPALRLVLESELPVASGMGSSAAVSVAVIRAVAQHLGGSLPPGAVSQLAYEVEQHYHGTPSGIDNTVIAYDAPIYFRRGQPPQVIDVHSAFGLVLADTGRPSPTRELVAGVRQRWEADRSGYQRVFGEIGEVVNLARKSIETGEIEQLGALMNENQRLLARLGVSSPELEAMIQTALAAGAYGAKLSGAGGGGALIATGEPANLQRLRSALLKAGAVRALVIEVGA